MRRRSGWWLLVLLTGCLLGAPAKADEVHVAVAANFSGTLDKLAAIFRSATGHVLVPSSGSSGQLYAQILAGAPFDVFLSADSERSQKLESDNLAVSGSGFVYARGVLVLYSATKGFVDDQGRVLSDKDLGTVALADPKTAPYGAAAERVLRARQVWQALDEAGRLAIATSVTQAYQFVATGNATCGFVALSQLLADPSLE